MIAIKVKNRNYEKVVGSIIEFVEENGSTYPIFSFTTKDGKKIVARNKHLKNGIEVISETSVERVYPIDYAKEFLSQKLPINNIPISYNKENPEDFIPKWI